MSDEATEKVLREFGVEPPPAPWVVEHAHQEIPTTVREVGPRARPSRVVEEYDEDDIPRARTLSDDELAAWQADYDADPHKHGGQVVSQSPPGPVKAMFRHPPTDSVVEAMWLDGEWHAHDMIIRGGSDIGVPDVSWVRR